jgi:hypothetical protein
MAVVAVLLGTWGWALVEPEHGSSDLNALTIVYGVGGMFVFAGSAVENVPWQLEWARILAPLATAGAAIGLLIAAGDTRIRRLAARRAQGHLLLIGPASRVAVHAASAEKRPIVHADTSSGRPHEGSVHLPLDPADPDWVATLGATRAAKVVVATGGDDDDIALAGTLWRLQETHPGLDVTVEIDDRSVALSLAAAFAVGAPDRLMHVLCPDDLTARVAAALVLAELVDDRPIVVAGDGPLGDLLGAHLASALRDRYYQESLLRSRLAILAGRPTTFDRLNRLVADDPAIVLRRFSSLPDLVDWAPAGVIAVVDHQDRARSFRMAVELAWARPSSVIFLRSDAVDLPLGLRSLNIGGLIEDGQLVDPWTRAADRWLEGRTGTDDGVEARRAQTARDIRRLVAALVATEGWRIAAEDAGDAGVETISRATLTAVGADADWGDLAHVLRAEGLTLHPPTTKEHGA